MNKSINEKGFVKCKRYRHLNESLGSLYFDEMPSYLYDKDGNRRFRPVETNEKTIREIFATPQVQDILRENKAKFDSRKLVLYYFFAVPKKDVDEKGWFDGIQKFRVRLQNVINEIDKETDIYFENSWAGNCGVFADRITYSNCGIRSVKSAKKESTYDFEDFYGMTSVISKGLSWERENPDKETYFVYLCLGGWKCRLKDNKKSTNVKYEDIKDDMLKFIQDYLDSRYAKEHAKVRLAVGSRQSDGPNAKPYEAYVIDCGEGHYSQVGSFTIGQNEFGDGSASVRAPLAGGWSTKINFEDYEKTLKEIVDWLMN